MFEVGELVAGKFRIDRVLGQGGMGIVVAATHIQLGQRVALKCLLPELSADRTVLERFIREARSSAQLRSEHICRVFDVGMLDTGPPYIVMELLEGIDLAQLIKQSGALPIALLVDYIVQACEGLAEAHAAGIVHRDLKPANLFVTRRLDGSPLIKILDFGIAKTPSDGNFSLTSTASVMGSPNYMAPEQLRSSRDADARSDIWALGVILYELACSRPPFFAESITDLALRVAMDPTPPLAATHAPRGFEQVVRRCLEKAPVQRYQNVGQLAAALAPFASPATRERALGVARMLSPEQHAMHAGPAPAPAPAQPTTLGSSAASVERPSRGTARWVALAGGVAIGASIAIAVIAQAPDQPSAARPPDPTPARSPDQSREPAPEPPAAPPPAQAKAIDAVPDAGVSLDAGMPPDAGIPPDAGMPRDATRGGVNGPASPGQRGRERPPSINAPPARPVPARTPPKRDEDLGSSRY